MSASTTSQSASAAWENHRRASSLRQKSQMRISREQFGAAELEKMSRRESERRMQQEIVYLQQQMAFLKKLMRQPESADSDT